MRRYWFAAAVAATLAAPAQARDRAPQSFNGPHLEGVIGSDGDLFLGAAIGYDLQRGRAVFGIENEVDFANAESCITLNVAINDRLCQRRDRDIYVGGRIGFLVTPTTLLYSKVGYSNLRLGATYEDGTGATFKFKQDLDGVRVGAGISQRLGRIFSIKGEYRYSDYEQGNHKHDAVLGIGVHF